MVRAAKLNWYDTRESKNPAALASEKSVPVKQKTTFSLTVHISAVMLSGTHPFDPSGDLPVHEIKSRARAAQFDFDQPEWTLVSPV